MKKAPYKILVTGGAGFIGSHFIRDLLSLPEKFSVVNVDLLTSSSNQENLRDVEATAEPSRYRFYAEDIGGSSAMHDILEAEKPSAIVHFAAESHVDTSIAEPTGVFSNNALGTARFLEEARSYWKGLPSGKKKAFRFINISTDEVFGSLSNKLRPFLEESPFQPNNPYAASKAAVDCLARAYWQTYKFPVITTHCTNNYGPFQKAEKLIPRVISLALQEKPITVHGSGLQARNWLHVRDHCSALRSVLRKGSPGEVYNIGASPQSTWTNIKLVQELCNFLDAKKPWLKGSYRELITFVANRPANDKAYALNTFKIEQELYWKPSYALTKGLEETVAWYLANPEYLEFS